MDARGVREIVSDSYPESRLLIRPSCSDPNVPDLKDTAHTFKGAVQLYRVLTKSCLAEIGESAFADCPKLAVVNVSNIQKIEKEAFKNDSAIEPDLHVPRQRHLPPCSPGSLHRSIPSAAHCSP